MIRSFLKRFLIVALIVILISSTVMPFGATAKEDVNAKSDIALQGQMNSDDGLIQTGSDNAMEVATEITDFGLKITWKEIPDAEKYQVYYKRSDWSNWKKLALVNETNYEDSALVQGVTYYYGVEPIDASGSVLVALDDGAKFDTPAFPTFSEIKNTLENKIDIKLNAYPGASSYKLYYRRSNASNWTYLDTTSTLSYLDSGQSGVTYFYSIQAFDSSSKPLTTFNQNGYKFGCLHTPKVTSISNEGGYAEVHWNKIPGATSYNVYYKRDDYSDWLPLKSTDSNYCKDSGFVDGHQYQYTVEAVDGSGFKSAMYDEAFVSYVDFDGPEVERSSDVIRFHWNRITDAKSYEIYLSYDNGDYQLIDTTTKLSYQKNNCKEGHYYYFKIKPIFDDDRPTDLSAPLRLLAGMCSPSGLEANGELRRIHLDWNSVYCAQGYDIYQSNYPNGPYTKVTSTSNTSVTINNLKNGNTYYYRVEPYRYENGYKITSSYSKASCKCTSIFFGVDVGDTYIDVNIAEQHMWLYVDGELITDCDVVTGNYGTNDTPKGVHTIWQRQSPATLVGADYRTPVDYWLAFTYSGCGIHDATWRSSFGGSIYMGNGSHGCVNTPYDDVRIIYNNVSLGTYVVVH